MSKVKIHLINPREKYNIIGEFYEIIANLKSKQEVVDFFVGLFTASEALMMARRIQVAKRILEGKNYDSIRRDLKVSYQTITKTEAWLHSGRDEYDRWIEKCIKRSIANKKTFEGYKSLLDKYPNHRILKNILS
ncbi:MAG: YerC/YecD family TrpR-related protein [Candidatus Moranbacteria bacterium]|nr:YerC/YecD family TrpR-related protein [Candidatus Moranbacteria bacterium]